LLAVEVVSPDTRDNDVNIKVQHYHRAGVLLYLIVDQERENGPRELVAYRWQPKKYQRAKLDEKGRFLIEPLRLCVQVRDDRVVCYDADTGRELGDYARLSRELEEADRRNQEQERALEESVESFHKESRARQAAEQKASDAEQKASDAEQKAQAEAKARAVAEKKASNAAKKKSAEARARAAAEKQALDEADRATRAEKRVRELEAALRLLQGDASAD
jgi:hypothetical protein